MATCIFRSSIRSYFLIGPVSLHWYGLMYLVGFVFAMWLATRRANRPGSGWTKNEVENLLYAGFLGVFLGGRIGYVMFYNLPVFLATRCICSASGTAACRSTAA